MKLLCKALYFITFVLFINYVVCNKYSKSANEKKPKLATEVNFRTLEKPYRMNKLNQLWSKAQQRLTEPKLKSLYSDLMIQDKEEIMYKKLKSEGGDKEGFKETELRRKLTNIMSNYGLREHFEDQSLGKQKEPSRHNEATNAYINKSLFKDKKLNMLWAKAESSGFTSEELAALREEFTHHQEKIDQYYELLENIDNNEHDAYKNIVNDEEVDKFNEINAKPDSEEFAKDYIYRANMVRDSHRSLRDGYDKLQRMTARGPHNKEFIEPKVQGLWKMAAAANFTVDELASLKVELQHYENRLLKLRTLHIDHVSNLDKHHTKVASHGDKEDLFADQHQLIKKHSRKVEKMHADIEGRILARHTEL